MTQFSSRPPFNDDPKPYVTYANDHRTDVRSKEWDMQSDGATEYVRVYDPRPEFDRPQTNPTNRLLRDFRKIDDGRGEYAEWVLDFDTRYEWWIERSGKGLMAGSTVGYTAGEIDHARRVLARLAALTKEDA